MEGAQVTLLERGGVGQESSWAGGGILSPLCPWDYPDEVTRLTNRGAALFPEWAADLHSASGIDPEYARCGMRVLPPVDVHAAQQWCVAHEISLQVSDEMLFLPDIAQVRSPCLLRALRRRVETLGGVIVEHCAVRELVAGTGRVQSLVTTNGQYRAQNYVVTAGAWSKEVLGRHALKLNIRPVRGQMLLFKFASPPVPHIVVQGDWYLIPRCDGHVLVGSTLEETGFDKSTTKTARDSLLLWARGVLPELHNMQPVKHWAGLRPASPDNIPVIGQHPSVDNLYLNSGHFRYGVTMAPVSAEILLNEIFPRAQPFDVAVYKAGWGN